MARDKKPGDYQCYYSSTLWGHEGQYQISWQYSRDREPCGGGGGKVKDSLKSIGFILWVPCMSVQNFILFNQIIFEIFESGWMDWPFIEPCHSAYCIKKSHNIHAFVNILLHCLII